MEKIMKQILFALSMLCLGAGSTFTPVQAMNVSASTKVTNGGSVGSTLAITALSLGVTFGPLIKKMYDKWSDIKEMMEKQKQFEPVFVEGQALCDQLGEKMRLEDAPIKPVFVEGQALCDQIAEKMGLENTPIEFLLGEGDFMKTCGGCTYPDFQQAGGASYKVVIEREAAKKLSKEELEFLLAHELGHIYHNYATKKIKVLLASLGVRGFSAVLTVRSIINSDTTVLAKGLAIAGYYFYSNLLVESLENKFNCSEEKKADLTAVKALGSSKGAIAFFNRAREDQLSIVKDVKAGIIKEQSIVQAIEAGAIDEQGNNLNDFAHPLFTERIAYCESYPL
jgi:hypothetical protein